MALFKRKAKEQGLPESTLPEAAIGQVAVPQPPEAAPAPTQPESAPTEATPGLPETRPGAELKPMAEPAPQETTPLPSAGANAAAVSPAPAAPVKTPTRIEVEKVMSEGLAEVFQTMTPQEQAEFRKAGEEAATKIEELVVTFKATAKKVVEIIRAWLSKIPRVNRFFLEQESKLKTDDIMKLQRQFRKASRGRVEITKK